jgi:hypothetical protein
VESVSKLGSINIKQRPNLNCHGHVCSF